MLNHVEMGRKPFKITKASDLILKVQNEPEPKLVWNGIVEGSKGIIAGVSKTGKTTLAENLAISLATGKTSYLNFPLQGTPEKVLFINLEESYRIRTRRNLKQISLLSENEKTLFYENYYSTPDDFPEFLIDEQSWQSLSNYIQEIQPKYLFIDSLSHMFEGQIEASEASIRFVKKFRKYIASLELTVVIVHHNTKGNEKPIDQDSIAGSRIILQEFEYAIGLGNIPTHSGGSYMCMLYNKYIEKDDTTAYTYKINANNWVENVSVANKFDLYNDNKKDYRANSANKDLIFEYINSQGSQDSQGNKTITTATLYDNFITGEEKVMSKETFHQNMKKLINEKAIMPIGRGVYKLNEVKNGE